MTTDTPEEVHALAGTTPSASSRPDVIAALKAAADALKPIANGVFNDNGDLTVSTETLDYDQIVAAWRAEGRARRILASCPEIPDSPRAALASHPVDADRRDGGAE